MEVLMDEVCGYLHNFFVKKPDGIHREQFLISSGALDVDFLKEGQYFRIKGSLFNDGVYKWPATGLQDEEFIGEVWEMAVPQGVLEVMKDIQTWNAKYGSIDSVNYSPFSSESFNNYSYSKGSRSNGNGSSSGSPTTWQDVFANRLVRWRRLYDAL